MDVSVTESSDRVEAEGISALAIRASRESGVR
jgi:hypothetical protein